jgi:hypothetical protein
MFRASSYLLVCCSIGLLSAQHAPFEGPIEGATFDGPTRSFRTITGSLGSAFLGPAVLADFDRGSVAPHKNFGVAFRDGRCLLVSELDSQQPSTNMLPSCFNVPEDVAWSSDGFTAVLYSRTEGWIQVLTGFPNAVTPANVFNVSPGSSLSAVATDFDGGRIVVGITGDTPGVYEFTKDQLLLPILFLMKPAALAFSGDGGTLFAADAASSQVFELNMTDLSSQSWPIDGITDPVAVEPARDAEMRRVVYIAGGIDRALLVYDASDHTQIASVALDVVPTMIVPLGHHGFLLRSRLTDNDPIWSFTVDSPPAVYFVPATPLASTGGSSR